MMFTMGVVVAVVITLAAGLAYAVVVGVAWACWQVQRWHWQRSRVTTTTSLDDSVTWLGSDGTVRRCSTRTWWQIR
jgi:MFS superfamily sulfate permease-like transporter